MVFNASRLEPLTVSRLPGISTTTDGPISDSISMMGIIEAQSGKSVGLKLFVQPVRNSLFSNESGMVTLFVRNIQISLMCYTR